MEPVGANKVFGIGLSRTGTTSLTAALEILGVHTKHYPHDLETQTELFSGDGHLTLLRHYQAVTDISVVPFFRKLDAAYPGSRFILTTRNEDAWIGSQHRHFGALASHWEQLPLRFREFTTAITEATYGTFTFEESVYRAAFRQHQADVNRYFRDRPQDFLVFDIPAGHGWPELCNFLGIKEPDDPFPRAAQEWDSLGDWLRRENELRETLRETIPKGDPIVLLDRYKLADDIVSRYQVVMRSADYDLAGEISMRTTCEHAASLGAKWLVVAWTSPDFDQLTTVDGRQRPILWQMATEEVKILEFGEPV